MRKERYTITDIAGMTGLSTRTIRTYIKNSLLTGNKIDGIWMFTEEELRRFMMQDYVKQSVQIKADSILRSFLEDKKKKIISVCSIYDYPVRDEEQANKICDEIIGLINSNQYGAIQFSYNYDDKYKMVRIIITGQTELVSKMLEKMNT